ncbi:adenylate/guanylate cyclase domain-containing protein [Polymorphum gilvum]|uniref:Adenylate and Guanylate cyclase catalytic domain protein n=1 Tax=Polymorphum gilvum (strain LMG 25793 / CGMCC 1.9160 / SL003B-26A1) TaxID=991905 RepID=F2IV14_POLGS|nr:adenylate/guanylate cyclase domain-containing protein [Polymorphum gilvum]ADZ70243.1 Adenylate and Guanylate cyclase catalytic domain protein [Polymorphum gilvum SL003B-26A1]
MSLEAPLIAADVMQWLHGEAVGISDTLVIVEELGERLRRAKVPVDRITIGIVLLHPNVRAENAIWTSDGTRELRRYLESQDLEASYDNSPLKVVYMEGRAVRCAIPPVANGWEYGIIPDLRADGYTDYIALPMPFAGDTKKALTLATRAPTGFTAAHVGVFESIAHPLGIVCELNTLRRTAETLLNTYVGPRAGSRVLNGTIKRGEGEWISAVVGFADLRGFTRLSNRLPADTLIRLLNTYFGVMAEAVESHGGEILKFIGDEVMSIFPYENDAEAVDAAKRALLAAREAVKRIAGVNASCCEETPQIRVGIALHAGDVFFGNVGSETRLDFTVVGPVVNLAARIAGLAKDLDTEILVSDTIADIMGCRSGLYGSYQVKGFDEPVSVFSPSAAAIDNATWCPESTARLALEKN